MRIVFMGTPDFAVASLEALINAGETIVAVITTPDKPAGRGQKMHESAVKRFALSKNLPVLQPVKLKDPTFLEQLKSYQADLQVVVAFRMLPQVVWNMPKHGTINVHASLLPQYRGAAPINHAIMAGEEFSGVTTFILQQEIDTGNILFSEKVAIGPQDDAGVLHDALMDAGARVLIKTVDALKTGDYQAIAQDEIPEQRLKPAPKIFKEDCEIDWKQPTIDVYNQIRGLSPYPAAFTNLAGKVLKIYKAEKGEPIGEAPGEFQSDGKTYLRFATKDGSLHILSLQLEGKKKMGVEEFLRGYRFTE
ncbi:MAG: methionyl-tRNA formyltransferase [Sphingobacterium sp.]|uniref:methionyl-tRNA formyltransferase n=1 Tax=Sphingobacterium sp. JB170 TaxID=1434842 RepID=UPI00097E782B|nr:methionyl-tRNA formyltransferase [Sphingobacterium sp. JB170]SJN49324.1 Methionyl-tRNA formyltransferase [Sphingobacterium sp. JB170]